MRDYKTYVLVALTLTVAIILPGLVIGYAIVGFKVKLMLAGGLYLIFVTPALFILSRSVDMNFFPRGKSTEFELTLKGRYGPVKNKTEEPIQKSARG